MVWILVAEVIVPFTICHEYVVAPPGPLALLPVELAQTCAGVGVMAGVGDREGQVDRAGGAGGVGNGMDVRGRGDGAVHDLPRVRGRPTRAARAVTRGVRADLRRSGGDGRRGRVGVDGDVDRVRGRAA